MSTSTAELRTIETRVPARMDRLPWAKFHWLVVIGLGTVWILDGLEVTIVGSVASRMTEHGSGIALSAGQIGTAAAFYVAGACTGALFFGQLTDRFGRKKLFLITLGLYIAATVATAFSFAAWYFYAARFLTGSGIGGEYAAINSAIDELIPARVRGRVDLMINGSYWVGAAAGAVAALFFLDTSIFAKDFGWRLAFGVGAVIGLLILVVRRHVPESPRWLFIHGREEQAEQLVDSIEQGIREETGQELEEPRRSITVRQRKSIPFRQIAAVAVKAYPKRTALGFALFVGQAFLYNAVTFDLGTIMSTFFDVGSGNVPYYTAIFGISNFLGPLLLGRLFDTVGRKPMITGTYFASAAGVTVLGILLASRPDLGTWVFIAVLLASFFVASAGASSAYLTVSEIFPMETRALAIAFFYAVGTAAGGITGPLVFGHLIASKDASQVAIGFWIGAAIMAVGAVAELLFGVQAEQQELESIAQPLTAEEAEGGATDAEGAEGERGPGAERRREALELRSRAEEVRARAAEHRAAFHDLRAEVAAGHDGAGDRAEVEARLADIADVQAQALDERAAAADAAAEAERAGDGAEEAAARERAAAALARAERHEAQARALAAEQESDRRRYDELAEAAAERARAREHRAAAAEARGRADEGGDGATAELAAAEAERHDAWAELHEARSRLHVARADGDEARAGAHKAEARALEERALAADERVAAAQRRCAAQEAAEEAREAEGGAGDREREERERRERQRQQRMRAAVERRVQRERAGLRRFRPGPGRVGGSPGMWAAGLVSDDEDLEREVEAISRALDEHGEMTREELARAVGARYWGPGRFRAALREAVAEEQARRVSRRTYAAPEHEHEHAGG